MAPDVTTEECARLARAMTLKNAAAGLPHGGGKSVLRGDPRMPADRKERLIRAFAHALRREDDYIFGPDMGTDETCMAWIKDEIGRAVGLPPALGGIPLDELGATGWGIRHAAEVAVEHCGLSAAWRACGDPGLRRRRQARRPLPARVRCGPDRRLGLPGDGSRQEWSRRVPADRRFSIL
jgi:glutamate dehydrogenase/leucine dehydrogenase